MTLMDSHGAYYRDLMLRADDGGLYCFADLHGADDPDPDYIPPENLFGSSEPVHMGRVSSYVPSYKDRDPFEQVTTTHSTDSEVEAEVAPVETLRPRFRLVATIPHPDGQLTLVEPSKTTITTKFPAAYVDPGPLPHYVVPIIRRPLRLLDN